MKAILMMAALGLLLSAAPLFAGGGRERAIDELIERIHRLEDEARALEAEGSHDEAEGLRREAGHLEAKVRALKEEPGARPLHREEAEEILRGLEQGIHSLERLGMGEKADWLREIADRLRRKLEAPERGDRGEEPDRGREVVKHHVEILRLGMKALLEAEKEDAARRLEHAIHARELMLEGRRDPEAREIVESSPKPAALAELMRHAAERWAEFRHPGNAARCEELARRFEEMAREGGGPRPEGGEPRPEERREEALHRVEKLEAQVRELREALERVLRELRELRR